MLAKTLSIAIGLVQTMKQQAKNIGMIHRYRKIFPQHFTTWENLAKSGHTGGDPKFQNSSNLGGYLQIRFQNTLNVFRRHVATAPKLYSIQMSDVGEGTHK